MNKILIVDDEKISLTKTEHLLSMEYQTICASSGTEALELFRTEHPDVILADLEMPEMSGPELLEILREELGDTIPFIFMTTGHDEEAQSRASELGAAEFIRKPFRADVLLKRVDALIKTLVKKQDPLSSTPTDPMTGLLNKASLREEIGNLCRSSQGVLMVINFDNFKTVNEIYGHETGDLILIRFSEIIHSALRTGDLTGRLGGDEFVAFCQNVSDETVIAEKTSYINESIMESAKELLGDDMSIPLGASIGCVFVPEGGSDFKVLFEKADKALKTVKQNGKYGYAFYREEAAETEAAVSYTTELTDIIQSMAEQSHPRGAYLLSFEDFRLVYRFLIRCHVNYRIDVWMLLFSIDQMDFFDEEEPEEGASEISASEAAEQLRFVLGSSLRQSDVVTQSSRNKFVVLLMKLAPINIETVTDRILKNWSDVTASKYYDISYEIAKLDSGR